MPARSYTERCRSFRRASYRRSLSQVRRSKTAPRRRLLPNDDRAVPLADRAMVRADDPDRMVALQDGTWNESRSGLRIQGVHPVQRRFASARTANQEVSALKISAVCSQPCRPRRGILSCFQTVSPPHVSPHQVGDGLCVSQTEKDRSPMPPLKTPEQDWRVLARQASTEKDPEKLLDLLQQVIETYDEAKRRLRRIA